MAREGCFYEMKFVSKAITFLKEVRVEAKKINWLTRQEVLRHTIIVVIFALTVAIYLGTLDIVFQWFLAKI